jgi:hypothetical protein
MQIADITRWLAGQARRSFRMGKWAARPTGFSDPQRVGWSFVSLEFLSMLEVGNLKLDRKRFDVGSLPADAR